jgi:hypothetical protein
MTQLKLLDASNRTAFLDLLREPWQQQSWTNREHIVDWRFFNRPDDGSMTWLAMDDKGACVGMLDSMLRPYLLNGQRVLVRETADWYTASHLRSRGLGLWLLMHMKNYPEPNFVLGGTDTNINILSKMRGWQRLPSAESFVLPLRLRGVAANWLRRKWRSKESWLRVVPNAIPLKRPKTIPPPMHVHARLLSRTDAINLPLPQTPGLAQLFEQKQWDWLVQMPADVARPIAVEFTTKDGLVGFSLSQIERTPSGVDGRIMYLQAEAPDIGWLVSWTTEILADHGVGFIRACVSTPDKAAAMLKVGYLKTRDLACHWWPRAAAVPAAVDVGYLSVDDSYPYWLHATQ